MNDMSMPSRTSIIAAPAISIPFGKRIRDDMPVVWDSKTAINGHMLISGPTGTGKTYLLNKVMGELARQGIGRIHVINVHGDLCRGLPEHLVQEFTFSEQSPWGLQPLELLDDADIGGVRRRALAFIALLARQGALGQRQRPALFRLLIDGYARFGFLADDPKTWGLEFDPRGNPTNKKRYPTLKDLKASVWAKLVMMRTGQTHACVVAIERVMTLAKKRAQLRKHLGGFMGEDLEKTEVALKKAQEDAVEAFKEGMETVDSGTEVKDAILWNNADGIQSLYDRLEALDMSGIFKGNPAPFSDRMCIHNYNIKSLDVKEQQLFVDCILERIYVGAKRRGESDGPMEFVFLDEADSFTTDDPDHIINRLVKEMRKFGIGMVLGGQSFEHFSNDLLTNSAVKVVLGCPEMVLEQTRKRLGVSMMTLKGEKVNPLTLIRPQQTAFAGVTTMGRTSAISAILLAHANHEHQGEPS